jgi:hypothetical protein
MMCRRRIDLYTIKKEVSVSDSKTIGDETLNLTVKISAMALVNPFSKQRIIPA